MCIFCCCRIAIKLKFEIIYRIRTHTRTNACTVLIIKVSQINKTSIEYIKFIVLFELKNKLLFITLLTKRRKKKQQNDDYIHALLIIFRYIHDKYRVFFFILNYCILLIFYFAL